MKKIVKQQVVSYVQSNKILSNSQSAYIKHNSTQTTLHQIVDLCIKNIDEENISVICCLDLSKAFDTLDRPGLLSKLAKYGFSLNTCAWLPSYLCDRTQIVKLKSDIVRYQNCFS